MMGNTTPKGFPQTPPASTRKPHGAKPIPKFQLPDGPPQTTPGSSSAGHVQLQTPATTRRKSIFTTPNTNPKQSRGKTLFPPSPDVTPQRSPRNKRKKLSFESFLPVSDSISVLLPNHGSVGSGRKHYDNSASLSKTPLSLDSAELFKINRDLGFEQELQPSTPTKRGGRPSSRKNVPATPGNQLITEDKINSWHGRSFHSGFSSDEEEEQFDTQVSGTKKKLANPFLSSGNSGIETNKTDGFLRKNNPFAPKASAVNYATHLELINHRTGERRIEALSEEQQQFKPKKIDFSGI